jgi:30S ribosomal protein S31
MGRGDRKTRKGKTSIRSYGNARPHKVKKTTGATGAVAKKAAAPKPAVKKAAAAPAKKAAAKKSS